MNPQSEINPSHQTPSGHLTPVTPTHSDINPRKTQSHGELNPPNSRSEHNTSTQEPQHAFIPSKPRHQTRALQQADLPVHPSPAAHRHKAHATNRWPRARSPQTATTRQASSTNDQRAPRRR